MKKRIFVLFLLFFISIACVSANEDINASETLNLYDGEILTSQDFNQLQNLINGANDGDTISLSTDYVGNGEININKHLTIDGNDHSIDASYSSRIFKINADNVFLKNIKFLNGNSADFGGAIYSNHPLKIDNCEFVNNHASYGGGAIYSFTSIDITNSIFRKNTAENDGAILLESSKAYLYNDKFIENSANWASGALSSIYESNTTVDSCTFIDNVASQYASAICAHNELNVINSNFKSSNGVVDFIEYFDDWDGRNGSLYLKNNEMTSYYLWDISYRGDTPIASPICLKFLNQTVNSGDKVLVANVYDDNGNTIKLDSYPPDEYNTITLEVYDKANKLVDESTLYLDENLGYTYAVNLKDGIYRLSGQLPEEISKDYTVIEGILNVGNVDDKFIAEVTTSYKKNNRNVILTSSLNPASATGDIIYNVNGKTYVSTVKNGKAGVTLYDLDNGTYTVQTFYSGDSLYNQTTAKSITFIIGPSDVKINAPDVTKYYKGPERFTVTLTDKNNAPLANHALGIIINGQSYDKITNEKGQASIGINLNSGVYTAFVEYGDEVINSTVTVKSTVLGKNITKTFRNATQYYATFMDSAGNLLKNSNIEFNINGVFYTRKTNGDGVAKLNINLDPKTYVVTARNPSSTEQYSNTITVLSNMDGNKDLIKYYRNDSQYYITLLGDDGRPVGAGENVTFNINGVFYSRQSNASGIAKLNINLEPKDYIITAEYKGLKTSNKIKVLSVLKTNDLNMFYKDGSKFTATLLDGQGNPYQNRQITFNINGVFYNRTTDSNGIAGLNINLMSGEYIITSSYSSLNVANRITIS